MDVWVHPCEAETNAPMKIAKQYQGNYFPAAKLPTQNLEKNLNPQMVRNFSKSNTFHLYI